MVCIKELDEEVKARIDRLLWQTIWLGTDCVFIFVSRTIIRVGDPVVRPYLPFD